MAVPKSKRSKAICNRRRSLQITEKLTKQKFNSKKMFSSKNYVNKKIVLNFFNSYYFAIKANSKFGNKNFSLKKQNQFKNIH